jgi:hypothetical protein
VQMWQGRARSRSRCRRDGPSAGADVAGVQGRCRRPTRSMPSGWCCPRHCAPARSGAVRTPTMRACDAPANGSKRRATRTWMRRGLFYSIRAQIAAKVAQELNALKNACADGSTTFDAVSRSVPHLHRDCARRWLPTSAPGLGPPLPHLHRDCAHPRPSCTNPDRPYRAPGSRAATRGPVGLRGVRGVRVVADRRACCSGPACVL